MTQDPNPKALVTLAPEEYARFSELVDRGKYRSVPDAVRALAMKELDRAYPCQTR